MGTKRGIEGKPDVVGVLQLGVVLLLGFWIVVVLVSGILTVNELHELPQLVLTAVIPI